MHSHSFIFQPNYPQSTIENITATIRSQPASAVLIQFFSGIINKDVIECCLNTLYDELNPICQKHTGQELVIIGATTTGEIYEGMLLEQQIVLSVSCFTKSTLTSTLIQTDSTHSNASKALGQQLAEAVVKENSKACILLMDGLLVNGEDAASAFTHRANQIAQQPPIVSGGMAGDNYQFQETYVFHRNKVSQAAGVAVSLNSTVLQAYNCYNLSWRPLGPTATITKSEGAIVYEINQQPIIDFYCHYLSQEVVKGLPESTIEFPLIIQGQNVPIARSMVQVLDNGGCVFAGNMPEGSKVRFGIADQHHMEAENKIMRSDLIQKGVEALFAYSCSARKIFYGAELQNELLPLNNIAPLSGFFTYGEVYHLKQNDNCDATLLNITTTILGLSEQAKHDYQPKPFNNPHVESSRQSLSYHALINLANTSYQELEQEIAELKKKQC
ncbi:FIST C-terminal domain-containing protein [Thiomicrorhabdus sp. 6S2-11]|uniref:FIST C-terminal domain-containing protein n=1 Tax=Thiomicrorhabdus marina TaxID=2818442 RepID=A0ABS3Q7G1_9GAMM|nr:FIST N-terminal domain-containing protein [Thiomicrorhabdus marina]MBO1928068.1 FIST C-terminal domain-containing protein [Thiomicrorhabdus marina]